MLKGIERHSLLSNIYIYIYIIALFAVFGLAGAAFAANPQSVDYHVYVKPSLKIAVSSNPVVLNLNPNSKTFGSANVDVAVGTNNLYGYQLFMNTDFNVTDLVRDDSADSVSATIPTLSNGSSANPCATSYTNATFTTNSWGYRINNNVGGEANCIDTTATNYYAFTPGTMISSSNQATNEQTASLTFASRIDYDKPAGAYELTLKMKALPIVTTYYMQDIAASPTLANTVCTEDPTIVIDKRDEQPYLIQKLDDNRCWMLDSLNLDLTSREIVSGMDSTNTNATDTALGYLKNGGGAAGGQWPTDGLTYTNWTTDGQLFEQPLVNRSGDCDTSTSSPCTYDGPYKNTDVVSDLTPAQSTFGKGDGEIGTYYNYCAASAGSYCYPSNAGVGNAQYDICPAGWRLPTGGDYGEYKALYDIINNSTATDPSSFQYKLSLPLSGIYNGAINFGGRQGEYGDFWTSTSYSKYQMNTAYSTTANVKVDSTAHLTRGNGGTIRCVLRDAAALADISTMQEMTSDIVRNTPDDSAKQLRDTRDNKDYTVRKINGNIWMTDNLRLGQNTTIPSAGNKYPTITLTPNDSNVTTTRTISAYDLVSDGPSGKNCYGTYNSTTPTSSTGLGYTTQCMHTDSNSYSGGTTVWYNYATATAGTIANAPTVATTTEATESICPKGWNLPSHSDFVGIEDAAYITKFSPVLGGYYDIGTHYYESTDAFWWSSTASTQYRRYRFHYDNSVFGHGVNLRFVGLYIRCVAR